MVHITVEWMLSTGSWQVFVSLSIFYQNVAMLRNFTRKLLSFECTDCNSKSFSAKSSNKVLVTKVLSSKSSLLMLL